MSLTSYRAAPPRVAGPGTGPGVAAAREVPGGACLPVVAVAAASVVARRSSPPGGARPARRRPALPRLEAQYHGRCGVSRPSSEWDRVGHPRYRPPGRATTPYRLCLCLDPGSPLHGSGEEGISAGAGANPVPTDRLWGAALTLILLIAILNIAARLVAKIFAPKKV